MLSFKGGVHPKDHKNLAKDRPIREINAKDILVYPTSQHIGKKAIPIIKIGERVLVGQIIAKADDGISANVISSVSGTLKAVEDRLTPNGEYVTSMIVENDYNYETIPNFGEKRDYKNLSADEIVEIVKEAGIVGLGGANFPTDIKMSPKNRDQIEYLLINAAECEPYITSDYRMLLEMPDKLIRGIEAMLTVFKKAHAIICIEDNKKDVYELFEKKLFGNLNVSVELLKTKYPQGGERELIYAVTKRKINSKKLPAEAGVIVNNVGTVIAVADAVCYNIPLIYKIITLSGDGMHDTGNIKARIGMQYKEVIDEVGGLKEGVEKIISGGPMMGVAIYDLSVPVTRGTSAIIAYEKDPIKKQVETNCISCGRCAKVCPIFLMPMLLYKKSNEKDIEGFNKLYGMECIECGSCSYICPAKKPLVQSIKVMKKESIEKEREEKHNGK